MWKSFSISSVFQSRSSSTVTNDICFESFSVFPIPALPLAPSFHVEHSVTKINIIDSYQSLSSQHVSQTIEPVALCSSITEAFIKWENVVWIAESRQIRFTESMTIYFSWVKMIADLRCALSSIFDPVCTAAISEYQQGQRIAMKRLQCLHHFNELNQSKWTPDGINYWQLPNVLLVCHINERTHKRLKLFK